MRIWNRSTGIVFLFIVALFGHFSPSCADIPPGPSSQTMRGVMRAQLNLGVQLVRAYSGDTNICISPYSIHAALSQVRLGAKGATAEELDGVLFPDGYSIGVLQGYAMLTRSLVKQREGITVGLANSIWVEKRVHFLPDFLKTTKSFFDSQPDTFDSAQPEEEVTRINKWVAANTADRIPHLLAPDAIGPDLVAVVINALYFKGAWTKQFTPQVTKQSPFWVSPSHSIDVPMMHDIRSLAYFEDDHWQAAGVPFSGGEFEYLVMVPKQKLSVEDVARRLETSAVVRALDGLSSERVEISMPRFELRYKRNLTEALGRVGLPRAMSAQADYSGIASEPVSVSQVLHESFFKVDEHGAEGAAATAVLMERMAVFGAKPKVLAADRPFVFAIVHRESGAPLFLGVMGEPKG